MYIAGGVFISARIKAMFSSSKKRDFSGHMNMGIIGCQELMSNLTPGRTPLFTSNDKVGLGPVGIKPGDELLEVPYSIAHRF